MGSIFDFNFRLDAIVDFSNGVMMKYVSMQSAYPRVEAKNYHTWGLDCKLQEERKVSSRNVGTVFGDLWDLLVCDYVFGWLDRWVASRLDKSF